jgi:hypothetical protein
MRRETRLRDEHATRTRWVENGPERSAKIGPQRDEDIGNRPTVEHHDM